MSGDPTTPGRGDRGTVLPLVLVFVLVLGLVLAGMARYTATNLRYSTVVEERANASASAEAALRFAIQRVRSNAVTSCENGPVTIAPTYDVGAYLVLADADTIDITCTRLNVGEPATLSDWAAVVTGEGISGPDCSTSVVSDCRFLVDEHGQHAATGRIFLPSLRQDNFRINIEAVEFDGNLFYDGSSDDCATIDRYDGSGSYDDDIVMSSGQFVCWPQTWQEVVQKPPVPTPLPTATPPAGGVDVNGCRVFEPGHYSALNLDIGGHNYFKSGIYVFDNIDIDTGGDTFILGGYPPDERFENRLITSGPCIAAQAADGLSPDLSPPSESQHGVTWYFTGNTKLTVATHTEIELIPKLHREGLRDHAVSIHAIGTTGGDAIVGVNTGIGDHNHLAVHGQIWAPYRTVDLRESEPDGGTGQLTSGIVAAQLFVDSTDEAMGALGPDRTQADHELLLSATATVNGVTVEARAVVEHRPNADHGDRVAVRSIRITD